MPLVSFLNQRFCVFKGYKKKPDAWNGFSQFSSQIFKKTNISYPLIHTCTSAYQGVRNVFFLENLVCFVFLFFYDSPFCLITGEFCSHIFKLSLRNYTRMRENKGQRKTVFWNVSSGVFLERWIFLALLEANLYKTRTSMRKKL